MYNFYVIQFIPLFIQFVLFNISFSTFMLKYYIYIYIVHDQLLYLYSATSSIWNNSETWLVSYTHNYCTTESESQRLSHLNNSFSFWDTEKRLKQSCLILKGLLRDGKHLFSNGRVYECCSMFQTITTITITKSRI